MTFADALIQFMNELADAKECEFWECPLSGPEPHHECCLTGSPGGE